MAIVPGVPGLKIEVVSNGTPLREYNDPDDTSPGNTVTKYVEAISGATFAIRYTIDPTFQYLHDAAKLQMRLDGNKVFSRHIRKESHREHCEVFDGCLSLENDKSYKRKFCFMEVSLGNVKYGIHNNIPWNINILVVEDEDAHVEYDINTLSNMGSISVELSWRLITKSMPTTRDSAKGLAGIRVVREKDVKGGALSHTSRFVFRSLWKCPHYWKRVASRSHN